MAVLDRVAPEAAARTRSLAEQPEAAIMDRGQQRLRQLEATLSQARARQRSGPSLEM